MENPNSVQNDVPVIPLADTSIAIEVAKIRVKRWLNWAIESNSYNGNPQSIPRAIMISFNDIDAIREKYKEQSLKGIRLYFGLNGEDDPKPPTTANLCGLIVPVFFADKYRPHADIVINDPANPNDTSVYDFTSPCPVYCDFQSELYLPI
ncbi:hypothetical protein [Mucilaginibacter ginsenosidivorans]|uniref:Uncharacterized protein n=1 Tax=Mucilaginibacter ginsenosidivorans TaxID=398053 RepID=A0A5B8V2N1_9SPHI|nr:hypothetical protein [Mucilaginibacter ginsenosidivorans]QEC64806.1 hypothetical protein FRZ54_20295 [Mucilaginibacter ginsenosidivorans]